MEGWVKINFHPSLLHPLNMLPSTPHPSYSKSTLTLPYLPLPLIHPSSPHSSSSLPFFPSSSSPLPPKTHVITRLVGAFDTNLLVRGVVESEVVMLVRRGRFGEGFGGEEGGWGSLLQRGVFGNRGSHLDSIPGRHVHERVFQKGAEDEEQTDDQPNVYRLYV